MIFGKVTKGGWGDFQSKGGVKGRLELFLKIIRLGGVTCLLLREVIHVCLIQPRRSQMAAGVKDDISSCKTIYK